MSAVAIEPTLAAFDEIAAIYDEVFTNSLIGQVQRESVWKEIDGIWSPGDRVLELNCGTGEDALHLAEKGINVTACDTSSAMIEVAAEKKLRRIPHAPIDFLVFPNEHIGNLSVLRPFDGVFSNFSGLNCVADLAGIAGQLAGLLRPGAELALVFSTRFSLWEFFWYLLHGEVSKATRRWSGHVTCSVAPATRRQSRRQPAAVPSTTDKFHVWYPRVPQIRRAFSRHFQFVSVSGIGVTVPPSYVESWAQQHRRAFSVLAGIDDWIKHLPCLRVAGDHMLLRFRRSS